MEARLKPVNWGNISFAGLARRVGRSLNDISFFQVDRFHPSFVFFRKESPSVLLSNHEELIMSKGEVCTFKYKKRVNCILPPSCLHAFMTVGLNQTWGEIYKWTEQCHRTSCKLEQKVLQFFITLLKRNLRLVTTGHWGKDVLDRMLHVVEWQDVKGQVVKIRISRKEGGGIGW